MQETDLQAKFRSLITSNLNEVQATSKDTRSIYEDERRYWFRFRGQSYVIKGSRWQPEVIHQSTNGTVMHDEGHLVWKRCEESIWDQEELERQRNTERAFEAINAPKVKGKSFGAWIGLSAQIIVSMVVFVVLPVLFVLHVMGKL